MAPNKERTPSERETLIFPSPEEARGWLERVSEKLRSEEQGGIKRRRELVAQELAREFESHGEGIGAYILPWEHSVDEHREVQHLVDLAFEKDLPAALKLARASGTYPRNIDLFHDVLTTEMYQLVREHKLHRQSISLGLMLTVGILGLAGIALILILVF